jgi:SWI/SNF-related matrix-associated actin-dependent regulator 1 of chromatin subfamily A
MEKCEENEVYLLSGRTERTVEEVYQTSSGRMILSPCKLPTTGIFIINYDIVADWLPALLKLNAEIVISDESHMLKSGKAQRTKAAKTLIKHSSKFIAITGTLIENRPSEAYTVINLVEPTLFPSEFKYKMRYCAPKHTGFGWDFKGASNTMELHQLLKLIGIRRLKEDVLKDLPPKIRSVVPMELSNRGEYERAEVDLLNWITANKGKDKADKAGTVEALARINVLKELCLRGKIESCIDWIEDYLEDGGKLVVFTTRTWILDYIYSEFKQWAVKVDGSVTGADRQKAVDTFQKDRKVKLFVGNVQAAGVGITLTAASAVCFIDLPWNPASISQASDRCHRIGQTECVNIYFLIANNSIEVEIINLLDAKQKIVDSVLDGKDTNENDTILNDLLKSLKEVRTNAE